MAHYFEMNGAVVCLAIVASSLATMGFADAPPANRPPSGNLDSDVETILDNLVPETKYSEKLRCLNLGTYRSVEVLDPGHLLFWGNGGRVWLNQIRPACIGLTKDLILKFKMNGTSLCELDRFEGLDRNGQIGAITAMCGLQRFEAITEDQAKQLRDTLRRRVHTAAHIPPSQPEPPHE
jgi:hypothetical protein